MNSQLKDKEFIIPDNIIKHLQFYVSQQPSDTDGIIRCQELIQSRKVNYGQLKRILHDMKYVDKKNKLSTYNLWGGAPMETWGTIILNNARNQIKQNKESKRRAQSISGINGFEKNPFNKTHEKQPSFKIPTNMIKSNSNKTSFSGSDSLKLFEEISRIKKLML